MKREYVAMLATMSTITGRARWWARSMTKLRPLPGSTSLRLAMGKSLYPVQIWICTTSTCEHQREPEQRHRQAEKAEGGRRVVEDRVLT